MELKQYQKEVISDIAGFIGKMKQHKRLDSAFNDFWAEKGVSIGDMDNDFLHPYDNSVKGVPHITVKVPTAGGKTFIACNALKTIFDGLEMPTEKPQVVAWFVPSDTILKQTYKNLSNPMHPYRQKIDALFNGAVRVVDKETALSGTGISPVEIREQLTIFVLSVQSFASNNREGRRVYRENENLVEYTKLYNSITKRVEGADETGLIQVLSYLNPVVIIDESHNFEAALRVDMLNAINPCFILDLTATPRKKSNIVSFVNAMKLKQANMVKLPVIVYNNRTSQDVITKSINLQRSLELKAKEQESLGGKYIRPIVLFQAQPRVGEENVTYDKIKNLLISMSIPEEQIKIKTGEKDEIKNMDLMSRDCPVRYIITVNALKEGWDCPFAYILASLANKTSRVDVEQILGRVLRLPYTTQHNPNLLNLSYVFTASADFSETIDTIIKSLNKAGFSKNDYRLPEAQQPSIELSTETIGGLFGAITPTVEPTAEESSEDNISEINAEEAKTAISDVEHYTEDVAAMEQAANDVSQEYMEEMQEAANEEDDVPNEVKNMQKYYTVKDVFKTSVEEVVLPIFIKKTTSSSIFGTEGTEIPVTKSMLAEGFDLSKEDKSVDFTRVETEAMQIYLDADDEYTPKQASINPKDLEIFKQYFNQLPTKEKKSQLAKKIAKGIRFDEIAEPQIVKYITEIIDKFDDEQLSDLIAYEIQTRDAIKKKIESLLEVYRENKFNELLDTGEITCSPSYKLPSRITIKEKLVGVSKGLYKEEDGEINGFEKKVIIAISNLDTVKWWHRNPEHAKGFVINGHINHYPDFIVHLHSGKTILLETKGDDRDNSNSKQKVDLGSKWQTKAGENYRYFMVFEDTVMGGTLTLAQLIDRLNRM